MEVLCARFVLAAAAAGFAQSTPNSNAVYQQLRGISTSGDLVLVENVVLKRDAGTFTFKSGHIAFLTPVEGKVTGAVFIGEGTFTLDPPLAVERANLRLLTNEAGFSETFGEAILRFTDNTYEELKKAGTVPKAPVASGASGLLTELNHTLRKSLQYNIHARILQDVMSKAPGGFFAAFINGRKYSNREAFVIDPHGVQSMAPKFMPSMNLAPEEVAFMTYNDAGNRKFGVWAAFHYSAEYAKGTASGAQQNGVIEIDDQKLDTTIDKGGRLTGIAHTTFTALADSVRVVPLDLYPTLRVKSVKDAQGNALDFIQEGKDEDHQFAVILAKPLAAGEKSTIETEYGGPDAVYNASGGNYYPIARDNWYPNTYLGDMATYELTFRIPRGLTMVATGIPLKQSEEGQQAISEWKSDGPQSVAGFNFGEFKKDEVKLDGGFTLDTYANVQVPDYLRLIQRYGRATGVMDTASMMKKAMGEGRLAVPLYTAYFGPSVFSRLALTQQAAAGFGQAWPSLVYLPVTYFLDNSTRHQLHMDDIDTRGYFQYVGPHEIAHEWWGHTVPWDSYRDQWMSEGFAEFSASLFVQAFYPYDQFKKFWSDERQLLTEKTFLGYRAIEVGPVTLGYRLMTGKAGFDIPRHLIYPKGAYILHMIRMMLYDTQAQDPDTSFKQLMHDFVKAHTLQPATTEDFKQAVERHMVPGMNVTGDGKMDWFFNEWVYGTQLPAYKFSSSFGRAPDGVVSMHITLTQSGVDGSFVMPVPIYLELPSGRIVKIGMVPMKGDSTFDKTIALRGLQEAPKRAMINYFSDVLCNCD